MKKEISKKLVDIINKETFKKALNEYNFEKCYETINKDLNLPTQEFTTLLLDIKINPLEYMNEVPKYFLYNTDIETFKIPNNIININNSAFYNCENLANIDIPDGVVNIGEYTFSNCITLKNITIPASVTSIGDWAFFNCTSLREIIIIPDNITNIGYYAFHDCTSLTNIIIGKNVRKIGFESFGECNLLDYIIYNGTISQWQSINKGLCWNYEVPAKIVHCTDGDVEI